MVCESEGGPPLQLTPNKNHDFRQRLSIDQLQEINGGNSKNPYAKLLKPKAQKKIKPIKPLTLKDVMNANGSPGPYLPGHNYFNQQMFNSYH